MNKEFNIIKNMKLFIYSLDNVIVLIPNRERVLKDRLYNTSYDILHDLYKYINNREERNIANDILTNISMLDFYLEICLKNKYISKKELEKKGYELLKITKMLYGIISYREKEYKDGSSI